MQREKVQNGSRLVNPEKRKERALAKSLGMTSPRQLKKLRRQTRQIAAVKAAADERRPNPLCGNIGCRIAERHVHAPTKGGDVA